MTCFSRPIHFPVNSKPNIILIGMKSSGKTTIGRILARKLGLRFTDVDAEVVQDGVTGLVVPKANHKALAEAVIKLLDHPDLVFCMGKAGRETAERLFSWEKTAEKFLSLFVNYTKTRTGAGHLIR